MKLNRRTLLGAATAVAASPFVARAQSPRTLRFIPSSDLAVLDPIWTQGFVTRNHGLAVFDTLYGIDSKFQPQPQMVAGHQVSADGLEWALTLREGLRFHDGEPVLAKDCVASIRRWGVRDTMGQLLMAATNEVLAADDKTIRFRLKRPFPLLPTALGKAGSNICAIMPERLAMTDPFRQVTEMVGSGPFRFLTADRVPGARAVYARFEGYVPRPEGVPDFTAGPKVAHFDRIEWHVIPDPSTAAAALQNGEMDWWENASFDLAPLLRRDRKLMVQVKDPSGSIGVLRINHLQPPFNNPAVRRALLLGIRQADFMQAAVGEDRSAWRDGVGMFCPHTPMATDAGMEVLSGRHSAESVRRALLDSGYKGERVVIPVATDVPILNALGLIAADAMTKMGMNVDMQATDWGSILQRNASMEPVERGGWSAFATTWGGLDLMDPASNGQLRATGRTAGRGWPTSPALEALRTKWLGAVEETEKKAIAVEVQLQALKDVPYVPLGQMLVPVAYRSNLQDMLEGLPLFWNLRRA